MPAQYVTSIVEGQDFYVVDFDPNGTLTAPRGSVCLRTDDGNALVYLNTTTGVAPGLGTVWVPLLSTDFSDITQIRLLDNANPALDIGSTGLLNLLRFVTTNGAEGIEYNGVNPLKLNTGGLNVAAGTVTFPNNTVNIATAAIAALAGSVTSELTLRVTHPGGGAAVDTVLPARAGGWRVLDAMAVASAAGGAGAAVQVQTGGAAQVSSNLVLDAGVVNGTVSRTNLLLNTVFASGATIKVQGINAPAASNVFITLAPL